MYNKKLGVGLHLVLTISIVTSSEASSVCDGRRRRYDLDLCVRVCVRACRRFSLTGLPSAAGFMAGAWVGLSVERQTAVAISTNVDRDVVLDRP